METPQLSVLAPRSVLSGTGPGDCNPFAVDQDPAIHLPVRKAIELLYDRYFESVRLSEIAAEVFVSQFHFSRTFARAIGVTPGRFLTALRLFEAKRLLVTTSLTVADVVCSVGYSSVGTFTSRFTRAVGMTPTQYRSPEVARLLVAVAPRFRHLPSTAAIQAVAGQRRAASAAQSAGTITGRVEAPRELSEGEMFVGAFDENVPQGSPVAFTALDRWHDGRFTLTVPEGRWSVLAFARHTSESGDTVYLTGRSAAATRPGGHARLRLRVPRFTDPPVAVTLATPVSGVDAADVKETAGAMGTTAPMVA